MNDDIVTRLRKHAYRTHTSLDAADEIERLRAEVKALKYIISPAPNPEYRYFVHPDAASTFAKLLRGDFND